MARRPRLVLPQVPLHIIQRGNNRSPCFVVESDYLVYLHMLLDQVVRSNCEVHAYVLMTNHVHLVVSPAGLSSASLLMKGLGQQYVQYFNRRYERTGTLWEGRFRSCLIGDERYLFTCQRYVELNPVRAGMVWRPQDYRWSSYHANALGVADRLIQPHSAYLELGATAAERQSAYADLFQHELSAQTLNALRQSTNGNYAFADRAFSDEVTDTVGRPASFQKPGRRSTQF